MEKVKEALRSPRKPVKVVSLMETVTHMVSMSLMAVYEDNTDVPVMSVSAERVMFAKEKE